MFSSLKRGRGRIKIRVSVKISVCSCQQRDKAGLLNRLDSLRLVVTTKLRILNVHSNEGSGFTCQLLSNLFVLDQLGFDT